MIKIEYENGAHASIDCASIKINDEQALSFLQSERTKVEHAYRIALQKAQDFAGKNGLRGQTCFNFIASRTEKEHKMFLDIIRKIEYLTEKREN